jgi:hypothetical protein
MRVYVVEKIIPYEGSILQAVYSSAEEAAKHCLTFNKKYRREPMDEYLKYYRRELKDKFESL